MNRIAYDFFESRFFRCILAMTGRVPAGFYVGWGRWMTLKDAQACVGPGWAGLVKEGFDLCLKRGWRINQIKEKFGGLRFYCNDSWPIEQIHIEDRSFAICEECGAPGKPRPGGWTKTLCDACNAPEVRLRRRGTSWQ